MIRIVIKKGINLNEEELASINEALSREFNIPSLSKDELAKKLFFLLKEAEIILAIGALMNVQSVLFNEETFDVLGVVHIISNEKGKGYGKQVVTAIKNYLNDNNVSGFGFCSPKNRGFYEKCGFTVVDHITQRFIYQEGHKRVTNQDGQIIFYYDSKDHFMEKVLACPDKEVLIPTPKLW